MFLAPKQHEARTQRCVESHAVGHRYSPLSPSCFLMWTLLTHCVQGGDSALHWACSGSSVPCVAYLSTLAAVDMTLLNHAGDKVLTSARAHTIRREIIDHDRCDLDACAEATLWPWLLAISCSVSLLTINRSDQDGVTRLYVDFVTRLFDLPCACT